MSKPTILTVDDDPLVAAAITRDLAGQYGADYRIVQAVSGQEALAVLTRLALRDEPVALIAADQRMPRMTGIELLEQARAHAPGAKLLLLTAYADTDVAIKAINDIGLDSQLDRASMQHIDVADGLDSTLLMLGHRLRDGVTVVREYGTGVPRIEAYAGELNQVWTNLIDNAVDAMDGTGALRVATRVEGDSVVVEVGDTGPGMPPQVAARAFEAFYTTKDVGEGTGLGLDIARRIVVERHGGTITIDARPGETVLRVSLPVRR
jgi:signal transduction histidine kinase